MAMVKLEALDNDRKPTGRIVAFTEEHATELLNQPVKYWRTPEEEPKGKTSTEPVTKTTTDEKSTGGSKPDPKDNSGRTGEPTK